MAQSPTVAAPIPDTRVLELVGIPFILAAWRAAG